MIAIKRAIVVSRIGGTARPTLTSEAGTSLSLNGPLQLPARLSPFATSPRPRKRLNKGKFITPSQD